MLQGWNATWTHPASSGDVTATNLDWNATIQPGAAVSIGYNGSHGATNPRAAGFTLNGAACA